MTEWKNNKDNMERVMKMYHAPECWDWVRAWRKAEVVGDKLEQENKEWIEQYHLETNRLSRELVVRGKKLEAIRELLRTAPIPPEEIPDEIMKILAVLPSIDSDTLRTNEK